MPNLSHRTLVTTFLYKNNVYKGNLTLLSRYYAVQITFRLEVYFLRNKIWEKQYFIKLKENLSKISDAALTSMGYLQKNTCIPIMRRQQTLLCIANQLISKKQKIHHEKTFSIFNYQFQTITRNIYETDQPFRQEIPYNDTKSI